ncbi:MAG TPA: N-formylglutamate deformylase [Alphaproteobacteria bacterium]|nr:N-formylglutamate deformylase [Alphaproteobacteria bacterium]
MSDIFEFRGGDAPLLISVPHAGTVLPDEVAAGLSEAGASLPDTDWHVDRLYSFAEELGASFLVARLSRYVIDLNRDPSGEPLYADEASTGLCPRTSFDGRAIHQPGMAPDAVEVERRLQAYWRPYHDRLGEALAALKARHGHVVLWDAHSIRSQLPRLFEGRLPDLNFGTARQRSCDRGLANRVFAALEGAAGFSAVRDGRFIGGYITRHYGRPADGVHAMQLELAQAAYMEEKPPFRYRPDVAQRLRPVLRRALEAALAWSAQGASGG